MNPVCVVICVVAFIVGVALGGVVMASLAAEEIREKRMED